MQQLHEDKLKLAEDLEVHKSKFDKELARLKDNLPGTLSSLFPPFHFGLTLKCINDLFDVF